MSDKTYKNITEVSQLLKINKHVIRYWDSKFEGISTRLKDNKRRFFSIENINKLKELKNILYENGKHNYSLDLAKKIVTKKKPLPKNNLNEEKDNKTDNINKLHDISDNLKKLIEKF